MIKRIELTNFMSHEHTVLEPAEGLTVLVGPNNCGKSAVVGALQILAHNENSKYVVRHGQRESSVRVVTDDGHEIVWRRKRDSVSYTIDGQLFDRLGRNGTPELLAKTLRLAKVSSGNHETDVHFGDQKRPIFLLDTSEAQAAQFFASSSDASRFVQMQTLHKQKVAAAQRDKVRLEADAAQLNRELETLEGVAPLQQRLQDVQECYNALCEVGRAIDEHARQLNALRRAQALVRRYEADRGVLSRLSPPPALLPEQPLARVVDELNKAQRRKRQSEACLKALAPLPAPPVLANTDPLERLIGALKSADARVRHIAARTHCLAPLAEPPILPDGTSLEQLIGRLRSLEQIVRCSKQQCEALASLAEPQPVQQGQERCCALEGFLKTLRASHEQAVKCGRQLQAVEKELQQAETEVRDWAAQRRACPTCGGPLEADRLLAHLCAGGAA